MAKSYSKILVTGGAGFIGSHIVDRLLNENFEVTVIDNLSTGKMSNLAHNLDKKELQFVKGDIRDWSLVKKTTKNVDAIFHEAAIVSVPLSIQNPILTNDVNVNGTLNLLKACLECGVKRFIFASSAAVYEGSSSPQKNEDLSTNPISPYGVSKLAAEHYIRSFYKLYGLETISLRYFNIYGPRQSYDEKSQSGGVISVFLNKLLGNMQLIINGDGEQTRDFVYVHDVVEANMLALNQKNACGEFFNIGSARNISINQLAEILKTLTNKKHLKNKYTDPRPGDVQHGYADISKAKSMLGYYPKYHIEEGLSELVDWYSSRK